MPDPRSSLPVHPLLRSRFAGRPLNVFSIDGRPAWIARELGAALGYAQTGKRLVSRIRDEWSEEFIAGHDYAFLSGTDLAAVKDIVAADVISPATPSLLVLFEPGLHLVLVKTSKPAGRVLRRFIVDEVLPALVRTGHLPLDRDEDDDGGEDETSEEVPRPSPAMQAILMVLAARQRRPPLHVQREERLAQQARNRAGWVDLCDRRLKVATLHRMADALGTELSDAARAAVELLAAEIATGLPLGELVAPGASLAPEVAAAFAGLHPAAPEAA